MPKYDISGATPVKHFKVEGVTAKNPILAKADVRAHIASLHKLSDPKQVAIFSCTKVSE